jgi:hypothetical protein
MEQLARDVESLYMEDRIELHFALGKAYEDLGKPEKTFDEWLAGNSLKRRQIAYDELGTLRQLESIREVFTPELIRARQDLGEPSPVPVFVVGMPRSGTTLIEQVLASHPRVFGAGELRDFGGALSRLCPPKPSSFAYPELVPKLPTALFRQLGEIYLGGITQLAPEATRIVNKLPFNASSIWRYRTQLLSTLSATRSTRAFRVSLSYLLKGRKTTPMTWPNLAVITGIMSDSWLTGIECCRSDASSMCTMRTLLLTWRNRRGVSWLIAVLSGMLVAFVFTKLSELCKLQAQHKCAGPSIARR